MEQIAFGDRSSHNPYHDYMTDAGSTNGEQLICPECGHRAGEPVRLANQSLFHWRRVVPVAIALLAVATVMVWLHAARTTTSSRVDDNYYFEPQLIEPGFDETDLQAIASGKREAAHFVNALMEIADTHHIPGAPGESSFHVGLAPTQALVVEATARGWPYRWVVFHRCYAYIDPVTADSPRSIVEDQNAHMYVGSAERNGNVASQMQIRWSGVGATMAVIVFVWLMSRIGIGLHNRLRRNRPARGMIVSISIVSIALLTIVLFGVLQKESDQFIPMQSRSPLVDTGLSRSDVLTFVAREDGVQELASIIQRALRDASAPPPSPPFFARPVEETTSKRYAVASFRPEVTMDSDLNVWNRHWLVFFHSSETYRRRDSGERITPPRGLDFGMTWQGLAFRYSSGKPRQPVSMYGINLEHAANLVLAVATLWLAARLMCDVISIMVIRSRRRGGLCFACGYQLQVPV